MAKKHEGKPLYHPALWPSWLIVFFLYCLSWIPMQTKQTLGAKLGRLAKRKLRSRYKVTKRNIELCFPEKSAQAQEQLVEDSFVACCQGILETTHSWWRDVTPYVNNLIITGEEHLKAAQASGRGLFLIGGHYSLFDLALPLFAHQLQKPGYMYRPNDNPVIDRMIEKGRRRHCNIQGFTKDQMSDMIEYLKHGGSVWYACDQDFGRRSKVFLPFFGIETGCIITPSKIARDSGACVLCVAHLRHPNGQYEITFSPIQENFGNDEAQDAAAWNKNIENTLRQYPDQYLWMHKRFKTRPEGMPSVY